MTARPASEHPGKAVRYLLNEYTALVGYLRDGRFEIDSNLVENDVRPSAVGKRRWLFIGHPDAGWRSAVIYTIIQSCRRYGLNPQEYLTSLLQRLPSMTTSQVRDLLPTDDSCQPPPSRLLAVPPPHLQLRGPVSLTTFTSHHLV